MTTLKPRRLLIALMLPALLTLGACSDSDQLADAPDTIPEELESLPMADDSEADSEVDEASEDDETELIPTAEQEQEPAAETTAPTTAPPATTATTTASTSTTAPAEQSSVPQTSSPTAAGTEQAQAEAESFRLLNELRASLGLSALVRTAEMDTYARSWSQTMATSGKFEHSPGLYAENIAWTSQSSLTPEQAAAQLHDQWINSAGHYENMTTASYVSVGVGFYQDASGWHATHVFD